MGGSRLPTCASLDAICWTRWMRRTPTASCIATSSPPTCSGTARARCSWTLALRSACRCPGSRLTHPESRSPSRGSDPGRAVTWRQARVLRRGLAWKPEKRGPDAAIFRHKFWQADLWKYVQRTIALTIGGLVVGAGLGQRYREGWPFRAPASLHVVVTPLEVACASDASRGERVARVLVHKLQGYMDFSAEGPTAPPLLRRRSTVVVKGTTCAGGDSLRVAVGMQLGQEQADPAVIAARSDTGHLDLLADTLAYGLVREIWDAENPLDPVLPKAALPKTPGGLAAWLTAERVLAQGRWGDADRAYEEAERIDSTCWLCAWRHADVDRWLGRKFDEARAARYLAHIDSFPPHYRKLIRASRRPLVERLNTLISLTRQRRDFLA